MRIGRSHAQWAAMDNVVRKELLDALWEEPPPGAARVTDDVATRRGVDRWNKLVALEDRIERIATDGDARLGGSRCG